MVSIVLMVRCKCPILTSLKRKVELCVHQILAFILKVSCLFSEGFFSGIIL